MFTIRINDLSSTSIDELIEMNPMKGTQWSNDIFLDTFFLIRHKIFLIPGMIFFWSAVLVSRKFLKRRFQNGSDFRTIHSVRFKRGPRKVVASRFQGDFLDNWLERV